MPQSEALKLSKPDINTSDQDLLVLATQWMNEAKPFHDELKRIQDENERYYLGNQTLKDRIPTDLSNAVQNQIFMGVETVTPIITANPPQFVVEPPEDTEVSAGFSDALQKVLGIHYETRDIRTKGEFLMRSAIIYRLGVWKIFWNERINNCDTKFVRPQRLFIPKYGATEDELPYIIEQIDITYSEFREIFGEAKFQEFLSSRGEEYAQGEEGQPRKQVRGTATIYEYWTDEMVFWRHSGGIIDKRTNPHFDFKNIDNNHFEYPRKPYIIASVFRLGTSVVGDTDLIQQTIPIQDVINVTSRSIVNNANKMGNATWRVDSEVMTEEEARNKITNAPGQIIWGAGVADENKMRRDAPPPLPEYIYTAKVAAERAFDNIFGTHSTTRGERGQSETLGGRLLLKQADIGRIDLVVREFERCVAELGNWFTQLMKINYTAKRTFKFYGETGLEFISLNTQMILKGTKVVIKSGTTLPTDELSKRREAMELWAARGIDPVTLYERLKFPNPEESAKRLADWMKGQVAMEEGQKGRGAIPPIEPGKELGEAEKKVTGGV